MLSVSVLTYQRDQVERCKLTMIIQKPVEMTIARNLTNPSRTQSGISPNRNPNSGIMVWVKVMVQSPPLIDCINRLSAKNTGVTWVTIMPASASTETGRTE